MLGQAQRGVLEMCFRYPGHYMFHAHKTEFTELGWMGFFELEGRPRGGARRPRSAICQRARDRPGRERSVRPEPPASVRDGRCSSCPWR